ncbi:MAG: aminomethyltransferase family protein [Gammaproteobacteria bacterium]|jgi:aminomethyltransferase|nr:aminomethyltransferase family protein [Gammaproteobacteria bacterium]
MNISHEHFRQPIGRTPFDDRMTALSKTENWTTWNCYKVPRVVDKLSTEYFAVRSGCAVMDLTPMEKYRISGQDARPYLDRLVTRDISNLRPGRVTYVVWCNDDGKVIDDGTLFQLNENTYRLCSQHHQLDWLLMSAAGFDVQIEVETHDVAALAVQGPTSYSVLTAAGIDGLDDLEPFGIRNLECGGMPVTVSRTGYTGDLGYELWTDPGHAEPLWDAVFGVQGQYDIHAMGLDALEMVRIEAGFIMPGFDFNTANSTIRDGYDRSPYEVGLGWVVNLDKGHFCGRKALQAESERPARRRLTKMVVEGNKPVGEAFVFAGKNGRQVGEIKCTTWSPILKANLALADIDCVNGRLPERLWARFDYQRELKWRTAWARCHAQTKPFYLPDHKSATPPARF